MNIVEFLAYLEGLGIKITVEGDRLRCNAPQGVLTPTIKTELGERKAEILNCLQQQQRGNLSPPPLLPVSREKNLPLSSAQQGLWIINQLEPESYAYNVSRSLCLQGKLNLVALEQSLAKVVERHEILRTTFVTVKEQPVQVILPGQNIAIPLLDLGELPEASHSSEVQRISAEEAQTPFNLAKGCPWRIKLLRLGQDSYILLLNWHHIIFDGWSMKVFMEELISCYEAFLSNSALILPPLPIQYADYSCWQLKCLEAELGTNQLNYWKNKLEGMPPLLNLPTDHPRSSAKRFQSQQEIFYLPTDVQEKLQSLTQKSEVTLFITLVTVFSVLLSRYSNQTDIVIGSPIANRNRKEIESLIGFFVNTLVLRLDLEGNPTFLELLARVKQVALSAYAHQDVPFEQLVKEMRPDRSLAPLVQVIFVLLPPIPKPWQLADLSVTVEGTENIEGEFDLILSMRETNQGLRGILQYNAELFDSNTIALMAGHFQTLLESIIIDPQQPLTNLNMLTKTETDGYTASDFADSDISQKDFENLLLTISQMPNSS